MIKALQRIVTNVLTVVVLALFLVRVGAAQTSAPEFAGTWVEDWPGPAETRPVPLLLRVTVDATATATTLGVEERWANRAQPRRPPSAYRLDPQAVDVRISTDHTFRWLGPNHLEIHEVEFSSRGAKTAALAHWQLTEGGRVLRIQWLRRPLYATNAAQIARVSTYHRADN